MNARSSGSLTRKTLLPVQYLMAHKDAIHFENGRSTDIKHAYTGQCIAIFDLSGSRQDHINYEVLVLLLG